jgi:uncharacterized protein involved in exopolysaccharide biosynthesis
MNSSDQHTGESADASSDNGEAQTGRERERDTYSLLDIALILVRSRTTIVRVVLACAVLGATYSLILDETYTSTAKVVQEKEGSGPSISGGLSALQGLGINLGAVSGDGFSLAAYPEILQGRQVQLAVARDTFQFPDEDELMTFVEYANQSPEFSDLLLRYTLRLPWTLKSMLSNAVNPSPNELAGDADERELTVEERRALKRMQGVASASINQKNGLLAITTTAGSPQLAADYADAFLRELSRRVRRIRTEKIRENLSFIESRFQEAQRELEATEDQLAQFLERNQSINSPTLRFQEDRLRRQVSFKEQLYSQLQKQLTQTRLDLQRQQPVLTVVEEPQVPIERSSPKRTLIVILSTFLGGLISVGFVLAREFLFQIDNQGGGEKKIEEIRSTLNPKQAVQRFTQRFRVSSEDSP